MGTFKHILVPIDFGETSSHALDFAIDIASQLDAEITLVHAYMLPVAAYGYGEGLSWPTDALEKAAQRTLDAEVAKAKKRWSKTTGVLVAGEPSLEIVEVAKERGADVVVMGTHGRRGVTRALLGSVAEKVVRTSPVPVLTVPNRAA